MVRVVPETEGCRTRGWEWVGERRRATRGDYEYNPPDRSVAKSAHSVQLRRLRLAAVTGRVRRGEGEIHSIERVTCEMGMRNSGSETMSGARLRGKENPRTCPGKCRVTCVRRPEREIASRKAGHATDGARFHSSQGGHSTYLFSDLSPLSICGANSLSCG